MSTEDLLAVADKLRLMAREMECLRLRTDKPDDGERQATEAVLAATEAIGMECDWRLFGSRTIAEVRH